MNKGRAQTTASPRFKSYPQYKDSGVEWLGEVPQHWKIRKTTWLFAIGSGTTPPSENLAYYGGDIPWVTTSELRESVVVTTEKTVTKEALRDLPSLRLHPKGSVAVAMYGATIGRLGILGTNATVNQACCVFSMPMGIDAAFWFFWLQMRRPYLISLGYGGGQPNLSQELLRSVRVPTPPGEEQRAIVAFLDRETAKIDELVTKKERLIELLREKRTALITRAVTKGLDQKAPMKDSGVEWLREIPAAWGLKRLKRVVSFQGGGTPAKDNVEYWQGDIPWVSPKDMKVSIVVDTEDKITPQAIRESATNLVPTGAVLIVVRSGILAHTIPVALAGCEVTLNQDLKAMIPRAELLPQYLVYLLSGKQRELLFEWKKEGATVESLELDLVVRTPIPVPDLDEQHAIVIFLDREIEKIDALVARISAGIDKVKEYRTALISAAVTGKVDVRGEAA